MRVYELDPTTFHVLDYENFYMNTEEQPDAGKCKNCTIQITGSYFIFYLDCIFSIVTVSADRM